MTWHAARKTVSQAFARWPRKVFVTSLWAFALAAFVVGQAGAAIIAGDKFTAIFTETSPNPGLTASATFVLGPPTATAGFFSLTSFSAISGNGVCLTCGLLTEVLSAVSFDSVTLGLKGDITGSFNGKNGGLHTFDLALTDPVMTWLFTNVHVTGGFTDTASGTYATVAGSIPELATWAMMILGFGLVALRLRGRSTQYQGVRSSA